MTMIINIEEKEITVSVEKVGPKGEDGTIGQDGKTIISAEFEGDNIKFTNNDESTVVLENAKIELRGEKGEEGAASTVPGPAGASIITAQFIENDMSFGKDDESSIVLVDAKVTLKGDQGLQGNPGIDGSDGEDIYLQKTLTHIQWKLGEAGEWQNLVALSEITGSDGVNGANGTDGQEISLQKTATHIQWRLGAEAWQNLVALSEIKGDKGDPGEGAGDMLASVYDPTAVAGDAFSMGNMVETATKKILTDAERTKLTNTSGTNTGDQTLPVKATGAEIDTGTDDEKFATAKAIKDSKLSYTDGTETLTNKNITKRVVTATNNATATIDCAITDDYYLTAMSAATTISVTGTPTAGQMIFIGLKDDGTTRALTWTGITALGVTLPATTTVSKQHIIGIKYLASAWRAVAVSVEA